LASKEEVQPAEVQQFQQLLRETGALDACRAIAAEATKKSLEVLPKLKMHMTEEAFDFLEALTYYLVERDV
jgi:geranylgeranyl pyrophosphate synthase